MLRHCEASQNTALFRILKTKGPVAQKICEKLKQNVKNIIILSEDELCVLWRYVKAILLEAQKLYTQSSSGNKKYVKEYPVTIKLIRAINIMALETILQRTFIPNVLLEIIMILHSVILPKIKDKQVKDEISYLLEQWWKLDMVWREKVIINPLKYLIQNCESSLQHVKRLHDVKSAVASLKRVEDIQALLKLVQKKTVMSLKEGRTLMLYLFTLGEQYILGIHNNVKIMLENARSNFIIAYANLYATAWLNAPENLKKVITENCVQNIIFHRLRGCRDPGKGERLNKNLLTFLGALHNNKDNTVKKMMFNQYKSLLWKHLKAPGSHVRCNAAEIVFMANFVQEVCLLKNRGNKSLKKYFDAMTNLLKDSHYEVCCIAMNGTFKILEKHWNNVPNNVIREWLDILCRHARKTNNSEIRINIFVGLKQVMTNTNSHAMLKTFLPNFATSIYDVDINVVEALFKLLWHAQNKAKIPFWDIVPLSYVLDRLETTRDMSVLRQLLKLVWFRISSDNLKTCKAEEEIILLGRNNIHAVRKLCFHSKHAISDSTSSKFVKTILKTTEKQIEHLFFSNEPSEYCIKKPKLSNTNDRHDNERMTKRLDDNFDKYQDVHILIDIIAMLLIPHARSSGNRKLPEEQKNILLSITNMLQKYSLNLKGTPVNESAIFLFSLISPNLLTDEVLVTETLLNELRDPNVTGDTILTIIYVFMKWEKTDKILSVLTNVFAESVDANVPAIQESSDTLHSSKTREKGLELSLRILKHLLHVEYQSVLMNKYHQDVLKFWEKLHVLKSLAEEKLEKMQTSDNALPEDIIIDLFNEYISMIPLLHKTDIFNAAEQFAEILSWIRRVVVPRIPKTDATEKRQMPINIIKISFNVSNQMLKQYKVTPKLCCDIVLLYCSCMSLPDGIVFINDVFHAILNLLDFSAIAYENNETHLLSVIVPNFLCATMITLTRHAEGAIVKYTSNLSLLPGLIRKYFLVVQNTFKSREIHLSYITVMFNTAISSISTEVTYRLQRTNGVKKDILFTTFPYLAERILQIILEIGKYQEMSIQVLTTTITSYTKIDMLSALLIIYKILNLPIKTPIKRLKNITLAAKLHNQKQSHCTPLDSSIDRAIGIVVEAILQQ